MGLVPQRVFQPPCQAGCPAGIRVRDYITTIAQGHFLESLEIVRERMPFPSACGRVCYYPCEAQCNRGLLDEPLAIMDLKRFVFDYEFRLSPPLPRPLPRLRQEGVAVIGGGPCGLTAARELVKRGYPTTVFEAQPFAGGTLRIAVPTYRLPREFVDRDIQHILALGVELQPNRGLGRDFTLKELLQDGYKAVLVATGPERSRKLTRPEAGVFGAGDFAFGHIWTVNAVAAGLRAAQAVAHHLSGEPITTELRLARRTADGIEERAEKGELERAPRPLNPLWQGEGRLKELFLGLDEERAIAEARRCLSCGAAEVLPEKCIACLTCLRVCPYNVPVVTNGTTLAQGKLLYIREDRCEGCGICVAECPARAIAYTMPGQDDILPQVETALQQKGYRPAVVGLFCSYGAYNSYSALVHHLTPFIRPVTIPCVSKLDVAQLLGAFEKGADGLLVVGCEDCIYKDGTLWGKRRAETAQGVLKGLGLEERLKVITLPAQEFSQIGKHIEGFVARIKELGERRG